MLRQMYSLVPWFYQSHCVNTQVGIPGNGALHMVEEGEALNISHPTYKFPKSGRKTSS